MKNYKQQWFACFLGTIIFLAASVAQAQDSAGTAVSVRGVVTATDSNGEVRRLRRGDDIFAGDTITTERRSRLRMSFTDGGTSVLLAETTFEITDYSFSGQEDGTERASFKLVQGALEAISGLIGKTNRSAFRLDTPLATIGLRGTVYSVTVFPASGGGQPRVVVSTLDGAIAYASPAVPNGILVAAGNSVSQTGNTPPTSSNAILVPLTTITVDGSEDESNIEESFDEETPADEDASEDTTTEADAGNEETGESTVDTEAVDDIIEALADELTPEQLAELAADLLNTVSQVEEDEDALQDAAQEIADALPDEAFNEFVENIDSDSGIDTGSITSQSTTTESSTLQ